MVIPLCAGAFVRKSFPTRLWRWPLTFVVCSARLAASSGRRTAGPPKSRLWLYLTPYPRPDRHQAK
eukprot:4838894-Heterocapsa_arctica.AAC.1